MLAGLNYRNLDEHPDFAGKLSTTEALAQYIAEAVAGGSAKTTTAANSPAWTSPCVKTPTPGRATRSLERPLVTHATASAAVRLLVPGNIRHNSGGNVYNASLVRGLRGLGPACRRTGGRRLAGGQQ